MCNQSSLASVMKNIMVMSIIGLVIGLALLISGIINLTYKSPNDQLNNDLYTIGLVGTLPAIAPIISGGLGVLTAMKQSKSLVGVCLAFAIIGFLACALGCVLPSLFVVVATDYCDGLSVFDERYSQDGQDFCDKYWGSLWAMVVFSVISAIVQLALAIVLGMACCCNSRIWESPSAKPMAAAVPTAGKADDKAYDPEKPPTSRDADSSVVPQAPAQQTMAPQVTPQAPAQQTMAPQVTPGFPMQQFANPLNPMGMPGMMPMPPMGYPGMPPPGMSGPPM